MPVAERWAYFNHAAVAPLPSPTRGAMTEYVNDFCENGTADWPRWRKNVEKVRTLAAEMIGAEPSEIAFIRSTTEGIGLVAEGFPWQPGDNVVVPRSEFPSNLHPWRNLKSRGVEVRIIGDGCEGIDPTEIDAACDARTRIVSCSWVGYLTGWRCDVAALCEIAHQHAALFFLDAIQGLGVLPLDVKDIPIDFLAADGHKWMLGPEGAGVMYVREENLERLRPLLVGWNSVTNAAQFDHDTFDLKPNAGRYEGGTYNMVGAAGLAASLELLSAVGPHRSAKRLREITDLLAEQLRSIGARIASDRSEKHWSGIVAADLPGIDKSIVLGEAADAGIQLSVRGGNLRLSPHIYSTPADSERLVSFLRAQ
ncbi:putative cysteine desulfurase [Stratiformator vulcanicus]|uniref:Putative cysteine desulfurase n=2 Tax=Stratiformator vulcanicus TaxID=2527980 RepID=A0A517R173_9PLAN|nr:putative cysteine desulfurase [Stratiformator vulcanicus]